MNNQATQAREAECIGLRVLCGGAAKSRGCVR